MKGFLRILFFLIIIVGIASPFGTGFLVENHYNAMISNLNKAYAGEIVFTGKFQRGFMSSTATTTLVNSSGAPLETLQQVLRHGPVIFNFKGWLNSSTYVPRGYGLTMVDTQLNGKLAQKLTTVYAGKSAYNISTMVAFNGDSTTNFINYPLTTQVGIGILKWQGANGTINIDKAVTKISGSMRMPSLEYSEQVQPGADTETLQLTNFKIDFNKLMSDNSDIFNISLDSFQILSKTSEELGLNNVTLMFNKKVVDNIIGAELKTTFSKLKIADHDVGPFSLGVKINNINSAAMMTAMQDPTMLSAVGNKIQPNIPSDQLVAMLNTQPKLEADVKIAMPEGNIDYTGNVEAGGPNIVSADATVIIPTIKMSQKIQIGSKIVIKLLKRYIEEQVLKNEKMYFINNKTSTITNPWTMTPVQLEVMAEKLTVDIINILKSKQYIIEQNDIISTDVEFANSALTINGVQHTKDDLNQLRDLMEVKPPVVSTEPVVVTVPADTTAPVTTPVPSTSTPVPTAGITTTAPVVVVPTTNPALEKKQ